MSIYHRNIDEARETARAMGAEISAQGRHATEPDHLIKWLLAFSYWGAVVHDIGHNDALAAAFSGYCDETNRDNS